MRARAGVGRFAASRAGRLFFALLFASLHVAAGAELARSRFGLPFDRAPGNAPAFVDRAHDAGPARWDRLVVSRWDAQHYFDLALRGFEDCPPTLKDRSFAPYVLRCRLNFYPTAAFVGGAVARALGAPIDYTMFAISWLATVLVSWFWTSRAVVAALGARMTWVSLVVFHAFTGSFALVTPQTEGLLVAATVGALVCAARRDWVLGAIVAGAGSAMRINGVALAFAFGAAVLVSMLVERPRDRRAWVARTAALALSGWGTLALFGYYAWRFGDPFVYTRVHGEVYHHGLGFAAILHPDSAWLKRAINMPRHEGVWVAATLLLLTLGHREALRRFSLPAQAFAYALLAASLGITVLGTLDRGLEGATRYLLGAVPLFFAIAAVLSKRPLALALWLALSCWSYRENDLCYYVGGPGDSVLEKCRDPHWIGRI